MPGDKKHHSAKMKRCVEEVMGKGHEEGSAYAICTTSMQNAGEEVYAEAHADEPITVLESSEPRTLHLLGATGPVRYEQLNGRRHLVVPIVALMEGVIHPVNAETPELVTEAVLRKAASSWVGKPGTLMHPKRNGTQCSAADAEVRKAAGIGVLMKSEMRGKKLLQEAWLDEEKTKQLHPDLHADLAAGKPVEVSVGAFVVTQKKDGAFNGKKYKAEWLEVQGDHLAFLPGGRGACSCEMGCGTHRSAMHFVAAESIELLPEELPLFTLTTLEGQSLDDRIAAVNRAVNDKWSQNTPMASPTNYAYVMQVFDDRAIVRKNEETFSVDYTVDKEGTVTLGESHPVKQAWVAAAAKYTDCELCGGTGQTKTGTSQGDCPICHGEGKLKAAAGARHSSGDMKMIQTVHDHATALGATCDRKNLETAAAIQPQPGDDQHSKIHIEREGTKWVLKGSSGNRLAVYDKEAMAEEHRAALVKSCA